MFPSFTRLICLSALFSVCVQGSPAPDVATRAATCNTPSNRACWTDGFDIKTDYYEKTPITGVTREVRE